MRDRLSLSLWILSLGLTLLAVTDISDAFAPSNNFINKCRLNPLKGIDFDAIGESDEECDFVISSIDAVSAASASAGGGTAIAETPTIANINPNCIELPTPNTDITPEEVVSLSMNSLMDNHTPRLNAGLEVCFNFSSDACRAANGGSLEAFVHFAGNPVFQYMVDCLAWKTLSVGPEIPGTNTRGAMKTVLIEVTPRDDGGMGLVDKKFLWTLMKERRPPRQGCWLVHECISVENAFAQTE